ncbi:MAG: cobyrinic acid ac-diamide synthase [Spirochaetaceae bacterium]|nr:MAG: cobyrinic acid ac-diamide synthase [Spirochaetaceae bacterium]
MSIAISSGKGGTGKTFVSTNIAVTLASMGNQVQYLDCDVEEPNGHLFLKPVLDAEDDIMIESPSGVDEAACTLCGKCVKACRYNAIALVNKKILFFQKLCHVCGACTFVCPNNAIKLSQRKIGELKKGKSGAIDVTYALLETGEGGMSPRLIRKVKENTGGGITILDSPPSTSCPVVETVKDADLCVLVTDPTPFGINDLKLAVDMCRQLGKEPAVLVNRAQYTNNDLAEYCKIEELEIIGEIPDERSIAECYSTGDIAVLRFPEYRKLFEEIAIRMIARAREPRAGELRTGIRRRHEQDACAQGDFPIESGTNMKAPPSGNGTEVVVISGKGGTGKTSLTAAFCALEKNIAISDCDVDAADLHLILKPKILERGGFSGGITASIDPDKCNVCGLCHEYCRFGAIEYVSRNNIEYCEINQTACDGCGLCDLVCARGAVLLSPAINGEWFVSHTRFGPMSHAKLRPAEDNSGKLVSFIRKKKNELAEAEKLERSIIDGSPGTGCPVIASLSGTNYAVVVTEPTVSGVHDLKRILDVVDFFHIRAGVVVNKHDVNTEKTKEIKELSAARNIDFLGVIPYDTSVTFAQMKGLSVVEYGDGIAAKAVREIWGAVKRVLSCKQ